MIPLYVIAVERKQISIMVALSTQKEILMHYARGVLLMVLQVKSLMVNFKILQALKAEKFSMTKKGSIVVLLYLL